MPNSSSSSYLEVSETLRLIKQHLLGASCPLSLEERPGAGKDNVNKYEVSSNDNDLENYKTQRSGSSGIVLSQRRHYRGVRTRPVVRVCGGDLRPEEERNILLWLGNYDTTVESARAVLAGNGNDNKDKPIFDVPPLSPHPVVGFTPLMVI